MDYSLKQRVAGGGRMEISQMKIQTSRQKDGEEGRER